MKICHLYARISTTEQDTASQLLRLHVAAKAYPEHITRIWEDTASGGTPWRQRGLAALLNSAHPGDVLIVPEISRIGRNTADVLDFIARCADAKMTLRVDKSSLTIGDDMQSKIITTIMALAAEIERDFLRSRTREGMAAARASGKRIGRPTGHAKHHACDGSMEQIGTLIKAGIPKTNIARITKFSVKQINQHLERRKSGILGNQ